MEAVELKRRLIITRLKINKLKEKLEKIIQPKHCLASLD